MQLGKVLAALVATALAVPAGSAPAAKADEEAQIRNALVDGCTGFVNKDLARATALYSPDLYTFDLSPSQHNNYTELIEANRQLIGAIEGTPTCIYHDMFIKVYGNNAYAHYILSYTATLKSGDKIDVDGRGTDIFEKVGGKWKVVHEHFSLPSNPVTGQAVLKSGSKPKS